MRYIQKGANQNLHLRSLDENNDRAKGSTSKQKNDVEICAEIVCIFLKIFCKIFIFFLFVTKLSILGLNSGKAFHRECK